MQSLIVKKGQIIQSKGDLHSKVYQVKSGLLRSYCLDEKGKEHIFQFAAENSLIADVNLPEEPCELFIDAIEDSIIQVHEKTEEMGMVDKNILRKRMKVLERRIIILLSAPAIERYEHFLAAYPHIVQRVPQRMIASYLGITPEALSKAKGERKKQK